MFHGGMAEELFDSPEYAARVRAVGARERIGRRSIVRLYLCPQHVHPVRGHIGTIGHSSSAVVVICRTVTTEMPSIRILLDRRNATGLCGLPMKKVSLLMVQR